MMEQTTTEIERRIYNRYNGHSKKLQTTGRKERGQLIGKVIRNIDPRFFKVATMDRKPSDDEKSPFDKRL